ncbi:MAG: SRPBCC domain-containing protein [bacterium]
MTAKAKDAMDVTRIPELVLSRTFNAKRALVFKAWLQPKQLAQWWAPDGFTNPVCELDPRPGGAILVHMKGPGDEVYPMKGSYVEIDAPNRLVFTTWAEDEDGSLLLKNQAIVVFEDEGDKTRLTLHVRVTEAKSKANAMLDGMSIGWTQQIDRLGSFVDGTGVPFCVFRMFNAPKDLVFEALTDPAHLAHWSSPPGSKILKSKMDLKPGGTYHYGVRTPDGQEMWGRQVFVEVETPHRLVYIQSSSNQDGGITPNPMSPVWPHEMHSTVTLESVGGHTLFKITWKPLRASDQEIQAFNQAHGGLSGGFKGMFDQLDGYLSTVAKQEILVSRLVSAPRNLVYQAFTDPKHINAWWGPDGVKNTDVEEMDVRVGGTWRFKMVGPDGTVYPNVLIYKELKEPERIVFDHNNGTRIDFQMHFTFEDHDGKTLVTIRHHFESKEARDLVVEKYHAIEGAEQTLTKLNAYLMTL